MIGNPPFLGGSKKRRELGGAYFEALDSVFTGRVPGGADLVCYWFDKARAAIETNGLGAAGLVATQSIRSGSNRAVLDAIRKNTRIFDAWSDEAWINDGAAVRVSLVSFGLSNCCYLNGQQAEQITADLRATRGLDLTTATRLGENLNRAFKGAEKSGNFDVTGDVARNWLRSPNPHGKSNADVLKPWFNGGDIVDGRPSDHWVVDFGVNTSEAAASLYEAPFTHLVEAVRPARIKNDDRGRRENWWRFGRNGADMRVGILGLPRFLVTVRTAKHRTFVWFNPTCSPDSRLFVIASADDATFGILSSRVHEVWSLGKASMHGVGNDPTYNAKSCFETFPFPEGLTPKDTASQKNETLPDGSVIPEFPTKQENQTLVGLVSGATSKRPKAVERSVPTPPALGLSTANGLKVRGFAEAIAKAAKHLNDLRENWLNPPEWTDRIPEVTPLGMTSSPYPDRTLAKPGHEKDLAERTLTKLYNQRPAWLESAHKQLDATVAAAYGWADYTSEMPDEEILKRLLALNLERTAA